MQFAGIKVKYHMGLMDDRGVDLSETIIHPLNAGIIIGTHGGDQINGITGAGLRADQFIVFMVGVPNFQMSQEQMLIEIAPRSLTLHMFVRKSLVPQPTSHPRDPGFHSLQLQRHVPYRAARCESSKDFPRERESVLVRPRHAISGSPRC